MICLNQVISLAKYSTSSRGKGLGTLVFFMEIWTYVSKCGCVHSLTWRIEDSDYSDMIQKHGSKKSLRLKG